MHLSRNSRNCKSIVFKTHSLRGALLTKTALDYNIFLRFVQKLQASQPVVVPQQLMSIFLVIFIHP